jgi:hypothetical protein
MFLTVPVEIISEDAVSTPNGVAKANYSVCTQEFKPGEGVIYDFIHSITKKDEKILSLVFNPFLYIKADRLPASGHYYYLPFQAAYNRVSIFNYKIDICNDIITNRPTVIWFDNLIIWNKYSIDQYEPCVIDIIKNDYTLFHRLNLYIRNDIVRDNGLEDEPFSTYTTHPSTELTPSDPIRLSMITSDRNKADELKRIGVMFGTYKRQNPGAAELRLKSADGCEFVQRFSLEDLADNKYRYFDLDPKRYTSGEIVSVTGGGVSTWESDEGKGDPLTCMTYEYTSGKVLFTPGCPL